MQKAFWEKMHVALAMTLMFTSTAELVLTFAENRLDLSNP